MIRSLDCRNLRSLCDAQWSLDEGVHLLLGGTGEGKTSLLEAIYLATTTRSFKTSRLSDCVQHGVGDERLNDGDRHHDATGAAPSAPLPAAPPAPSQRQSDGFFTCVEIENVSRARLELAWSASEGTQRRLNGDRSTLEEHLSQQPILAFSVADIEVLVGAPVLRRRLLDRISVALFPPALSVLTRYRRALDHKRALLAQRGGFDRDALRSFNELLADAAAALIARRHLSIEALRAALIAVSAEFPKPRFKVDVAYRSSPDLGGSQPGSPTDAGAVLDKLEQALPHELRTHRPQVGPHRDRISVLFNGRPVAETASAGELKAIGLLLLAAQARLLQTANRACVLLVDDVDTEMDQATLEAVWPLLVQGPQTLLSSNREAVFEGLDVGCVWDVDQGTVNRR